MDGFGILPIFDRKLAEESKFLRKTLNFSLGGHFMPKGGLTVTYDKLEWFLEIFYQLA
jgi:hypothetical protein